jgi:ribosomal protein L35
MTRPAKPFLIAVAVLAALSASAQAQKPKDMLWGLAGDWCSVDKSTARRFTITDRGQLIDGNPGEAPICTMKSATNRNQAWGDHVITWRCDPTPPHKPEDKRTPPSKFYDLTERISYFVQRDKEGARNELLMRERRGRRELFEVCRTDEGEK